MLHNPLSSTHPNAMRTPPPPLLPSVEARHRVCPSPASCGLRSVRSLMHRFGLLLLTLFGVQFATACTPRPETDLHNHPLGARGVVETFLKAWNRQDLPLMEELYPGLKTMDYFYTTDGAKIVRLVPRSATVTEVHCHSSRLEIPGREVGREITLVVCDSMPDAPQIVDSYGLAAWEQYPYFPFARRTGCVPTSKVLSDITLSRRMEHARQMLFIYAQALYSRLGEDVRIVENTPVGGDGKHAEGVALVRNDSPFDLPELRYTIILYDDQQHELGRHQGHATQELLPAGGACAFCYTVELLPRATMMHFVLDFDVEMIVDYVMDYEAYSGTEYDDFCRRELHQGETAPVRRVSSNGRK